MPGTSTRPEVPGPSARETLRRYRGLFLATYTVRAGQAWCGYTKVSADEPASAWEMQFPLRKLFSGDCEHEDEAHDRALAAARSFLDRVFEAAERAGRTG